MSDFLTSAQALAQQAWKAEHTKVCNKCGCWDSVHYSSCPKLKLTLSEVTSCGNCPLSSCDGSENPYCAFPGSDVSMDEMELSTVPAKCPLHKQSLMVMLK